MRYSVKNINNKISIASDYNAEWIEAAKKLGGRWNPGDGAWEVASEIANEAIDAAANIYGYDVRSGEEPEQAESVVVRVKSFRGDAPAEILRGPITICGITLARAFGRDGGAKLGSNVALLAGEIDSGGSCKNWTTRASVGTTFKLHSLSAGLAAKIKSELADSRYFEIIDE